MKKCPPGVVCIENYSMFFIVICASILVYLVYTTMIKPNVIVHNNNSPTEKIVIRDSVRENQPSFFGGLIPSWPYSNAPNDVLLNPYAPPLRDERYFIPEMNARVPLGAVPINVSTNIGAVDTTYRQIGILTPAHGSSKDSILPLMGRPLFTNRDMWNYYTTSNQHNNVKLPISKGGKSCTNEYGCNRLFSGDTVYVEGANEPYKVTMYDSDTIRYLPFI
jgi:hypothetical protein